MSKFTPGKWIADDVGEYVFMQTPESLEMVAQMRGWSYLTETLHLTPEEAIEVQKINARLIAHAPEMFDMLLECAEFLEELTMMQCEGCSEYAEELNGRIETLLSNIENMETKND